MCKDLEAMHGMTSEYRNGVNSKRCVGFFFQTREDR